MANYNRFGEFIFSYKQPGIIQASYLVPFPLWEKEANDRERRDRKEEKEKKGIT